LVSRRIAYRWSNKPKYLINGFHRPNNVPIPEKQKKVISLLADGKFHSGTELAQALGVSRSAIWKHLQGLEEVGLYHTAVNGKGYRLERPLEFLAIPEITALLNDAARSVLTELEIHDQIDSTNRYLEERASQRNAASGSACLAEQQTAGKGRRGRQWVSPFGSNIYLSLLWRFQQGYAATSGLSLAMGVAVIRALRELGVSSVGLKWPNDIYSLGRKLGGILIEVSGEADGPCHTIIGLGLNVYLPEQQATGINQEWTDLSRLVTGAFPGRNRLAAGLLNHLLGVLLEFEQTGIAGFVDEWRAYDCLKGQPARLYIGGQQLDGRVLGIDDSGLLLLELADGRIQAFASGEVSFRPSSP